MRGILLLLILIPVLGWAEDDAKIFRHGKLKNGLTYYVRHTRFRPGYADFYLVQNVGALMEEDNQNGLAHFLEHMAFNGSESFGEGIPNFLNRKGVKMFNAQTGHDETVYYVNGVPVADSKLVDSCLLVLKDWSGFLLLDAKEIDKERGVIFEERRTRRDVNTRMREITDPFVFNGSKYATHTIIGTVDVLENFTPEELRAYYNDFYRPDQQAVIVLGDIDVERVEKEIFRLFDPIPKRENPKPRRVEVIPDNLAPLYTKAIDREIPEPSMMLMKRVKKTPSTSLEGMMKENLIGLFYNRIMEKYLSAYINTQSSDFLTTMVSFGDLVRGYGKWTVYLQAYPHQEKKALQQLMTEINRVHRFALNDKELKEQVDRYLPGLDETEKYKDKLSNEVYVQIYQRNFLEGKPLCTVEDDIRLSRKILSELTAKDLQDWVASWNSDDRNWVFVMQGNDDTYEFPTAEEITEIMQEARQAELTAVEVDVQPVPLMDFEVKGGEIVKEKKMKALDAEEWTLSNGCKVYYKFCDTDGVKVSLMGESPGGMSLLPAEDLPSASALASLMTKSGLYKHDMRMMQAIMKGHEVVPGIDLGETYEGVNGYCDNNEAEMLFQLIYLLFEKPRFSRDDFDKFVYLNKMSYGNTPRTVNDTIGERINQLRLNDSPRLWKTDDKYYDAMDYDKMVAIYHDRFQDASDFTFYLVGNIGREEARKLVKQYLGAIPSIYRKEEAVRYDLRKKGAITETIEANIPDDKYIVNIEFSNTLKLKPIEVLCMDIIQMALTNRYREVIRENEGGAYGVNVGASANNGHQFVGVGFQTNTSMGDRMRGIVYEEIQKLISEGVSDEDVEDAVLMMKKGRVNVLKNRGNAHWMEAIRHYAQTGKDIDSPKLFENVIDKIKGKDVQALAKKFFATAECVDIVVKSK